MGNPLRKGNVFYLDAYRAARKAEPEPRMEKPMRCLNLFLDDGSEVQVDFFGGEVIGEPWGTGTPEKEG